MCFLIIDGKRFNTNHITSIEAKESSGANGEFYMIEIVSQPETYKTNTMFKTRKECESYIDQCLGDMCVDRTKKPVHESFNEQVDELQFDEESMPIWED